MPYSQLLRLATLTAFVLSIHTSALHAQGVHNTVLYSADNVATGQISGKLTCETGPLDGVHVSLMDGGKTIANISTGPDGNYSFRELMPGKYDIVCYKDNYRKRVVYEVPVVEYYLTHNDLLLSKIIDRRDERQPNIKYYEDLKDTKIEKMQ